jgi:hypothetical protein
MDSSMNLLLRTRLACLLVGCTVSGALGCKAESSASSDAPSASQAATPLVLLEGTFRRVSKKANGKAQIIRRGERYQIRLLGVSVDTLGETHVYLVGLPDARSTAEVIQATNKYDFGPLRQGAFQQLIDLPSKPALELRTVVLYEPRFHVNLAAAPLNETSVLSP